MKTNLCFHLLTLQTFLGHRFRGKQSTLLVLHQETSSKPALAQLPPSIILSFPPRVLQYCRWGSTKELLLSFLACLFWCLWGSCGLYFCCAGRCRWGHRLCGSVFERSDKMVVGLLLQGRRCAGLRGGRPLPSNRALVGIHR